MLSNKAIRKLISNLKGRISKVLTWTKELQGKEIFYLGELFNTLDDIIVYDKEFTENKVLDFKSNLRDSLNIIKGSDKPYVKKHIVPMVKKVVDQEWVKNE